MEDLTQKIHTNNNLKQKLQQNDYKENTYKNQFNNKIFNKKIALKFRIKF